MPAACGIGLLFNPLVRHVEAAIQQRGALAAGIAHVDPRVTVRPFAHFPAVLAFDAD